ncbi:MAG: hypothetical protein O7F71_21440, partial [Gammaproteobacteria bacterium]|nr:hypothetical protein [Gammaproteobacteria bacterium]
MQSREQGLHRGLDAQPLQQVLGYLNFSSGASDPQFLATLNLLFAEAEEQSPTEPIWRCVCTRLEKSLHEVEQSSSAFADAQQARHVLSLLREFFPAYFRYHADLLAHVEDQLINSFFFGRAAEAILACGPDWDNTDELLSLAIRRISDYIGYRPVATLESQKIEPYEHEWIRPVPLFISGAGVAVGRYQQLVDECLRQLRATDEPLLTEAYFDPDRMDELALDPRAYDFEHPANKRPNHHFGQWDLHHIDNKGFYRRFVVQQVTADALLRRVEETNDFSQDELLVEAAAVLAGTILMSSGISGHGPETHDSTVSLSSLLVKIAAYRDAFYEQLLNRLDGTHAARLREEAKRLQQAFAGARQDLNSRLTERRATQLQRVQLAKVSARMGYAEAAEEQAGMIQVPAARLNCQIDCLLTASRSSVQRREFSTSFDSLEEARRTLLRGIECGAIVDPWNILGFDGNFSLFAALENSLHDYRIDDLIDVIEEMLELYAQLWSSAAANERRDIAEQVSVCFEQFANWWHQFAAHTLDTVDAEDPLAVYRAGRNVAEALQAWHAQGEATGDIGFWAPHVQKFDSCRAYWLVVNTLLAREDKVAALGLLMHWLSQADRIPLEHCETSFFQVSLQWLGAALKETGDSKTEQGTGWRRIRRYFDYLEANAGDYWHVPQFSPKGEPASPEGQPLSTEEELENEDEEQDEQLFSAAYENVVYRDSTDDGMEGSVFDFDTHNEDYLQQTSRPIVDRLAFLEQLASIWKLIAVAWSTAVTTESADAMDEEISASIRDLLQNAVTHMSQSRDQLNQLLEAVSRYRLAHPGGDPDSMVSYDRLRLLKDSLTDQIINTQVRVIEGLQFLLAAMTTPTEADGDDSKITPAKLKNEDRHAVQLLRAALHGDSQVAANVWEGVRESLAGQPILYVPLTRGGPPKTIVRVKARQKLMQNMLHWLPRLGLLRETYQLIELARQMERRLPVGSGAITEFDDLFEVGCRAAVAALIDTLESAQVEDQENELWLVTYLEEMMEPLLRSWLAHSRTLRLSVLEQVMDDDQWQELVEFITRFGRDLFTQRFLNLGNVRGILHQGVKNWLERLQEFTAEDNYQPLVDALENDLNLDEAAEKLTLILEAVVESYGEYRDYNLTTTQSDRGDLLYSLLDFLRLRTSYDRVVWNLRPIVLAHQVLACHGFQEAANQWRQSLKQRIASEAQRHLLRLKELEEKYAMRLPSVSERVNERFMRP